MTLKFRRTLLGVLVCVGMTSFAGLAKAELTEVYSFTAPDAVSVLMPPVYGPGDAFYGSAFGGGPDGLGTVFRINRDGKLTRLHAFDGDDGANPVSALIVGETGDLYGTTAAGGPQDRGTVYRISTAGEFTKIADFDEANGRVPFGAIAFGPGGAIYGTTAAGGSFDAGTIFRVDPATGTISTLHSFDEVNGKTPYGGLTKVSDTEFFGTTSAGGLADAGTVFSITVSGVYSTIGHLADIVTKTPYSTLALGPDGSVWGMTNDSLVAGIFRVTPERSLTLEHSFTRSLVPSIYGGNLRIGPDGALYGAGWFVEASVPSNSGTIFRFSLEEGYSVVSELPLANSDPTRPVYAGRFPIGIWFGPDELIYGVSSTGGRTGAGAIFRVSAEGVPEEFAVIGYTQGAYPMGDMVKGPDGTLYGRTALGGDDFFGTLFEFSPNGEFKTVRSFVDAGSAPRSPLLVDGNSSLFFTHFSSADREHVVSRVDRDGSVHKIGGQSLDVASFTNAGLAFGADGKFYGAATYGGISGENAAFRMSFGGIFEKLDSFSGSGRPHTQMILGDDGALYGTAEMIRRGTIPEGNAVYRLDAQDQLTELVSFPTADYISGIAQGTDGGLYFISGSDSSLMAWIGKIFPDGRYEQVVSYPDAGRHITNSSSYPFGIPTKPQLTVGPGGIMYGIVDGRETTSPTSSIQARVFALTPWGEMSTVAEFEDPSSFPNKLIIDANGDLVSTTMYGGLNNIGMIFRVAILPYPASVTANAIDGALEISWTSVDRAEAYDVYVSTIQGAPSGDPAASDVQGTSVTIPNLINGDTYHVRVVAKRGNTQSPASQSVSATPLPAAPLAPANLTAQPMDMSVALSWEPSVTASYYDIYMGSASQGIGDTPVVTGVTTPSALIQNLTNGTTYQFVVRAVLSLPILNTALLTSPNSNLVSATPESVLPAVPQSLEVLNGDGVVSLSWLPSARTQSYTILQWIGSPDGPPAIALSDVLDTSVLIEQLENGKTYHFAVQGENAIGNGPRSAIVSAQPSSANVTPGPVDPGGGSDNDSGTSSSGGGAIGLRTLLLMMATISITYVRRRKPRPSGTN